MAFYKFVSSLPFELDWQEKGSIEMLQGKCKMDCWQMDLKPIGRILKRFSTAFRGHQKPVTKENTKRLLQNYRAMWSDEEGAVIWIFTPFPESCVGGLVTWLGHHWRVVESLGSGANRTEVDILGTYPWRPMGLESSCGLSLLLCERGSSSLPPISSTFAASPWVKATASGDHERNFNL